MFLNGEISLRIKYRKNIIMTTNGIQNTGRIKLFSRMTTSGWGLISAIAIDVLLPLNRKFWSWFFWGWWGRRVPEEGWSTTARFRYASPRGDILGLLNWGPLTFLEPNPTFNPSAQWNMAAYAEFGIAVIGVVASCRSSGTCGRLVTGVLSRNLSVRSRPFIAPRESLSSEISRVISVKW
jgi:hypothetical protein